VKKEEETMQVLEEELERMKQIKRQFKLPSYSLNNMPVYKQNPAEEVIQEIEEELFN
jgi:hypothetical protein